MSNISFLQVATNEKIPGYYGEISTVNANQGVFDYPTRILVTGQKTAAGTTDPLRTNIITDKKQAQELFGRGSALALMCTVILGIQDTIEIHAMAQDDDEESATASGSILVANTATQNGTLYLYVAGTRLSVGVSSTDTAVQIASNIVSKISEMPDLPVTAAVNGDNGAQVDVTAKNAGLIGNEIVIDVNFYSNETYPNGLDLTITQFAGGTNNPDISDVIDAIEGEWFTDIIMPYTDAANLTALEAELKDRFSATGKMDAQAYIAVSGTFSENYTFSNARNSEYVSVIPVPSDALDPSYLWAAAFGAYGAFWSNQHPAKPYKGLPLKGLKPPKTRYTTTERRVFLSNGCSTWTLSANGEVVLERVVTMYQENSGGIEDETYLDITTVKTFSHIRYDHNAYITTLYFGDEGKVLTENDAAASVSDILVTPKTIAASTKARSQLWVNQGWVSELIDLKAEVDLNDPNRVNMLASIDITNPLMILAAKLDMRV